jgi:hypothetical protein
MAAQNCGHHPSDEYGQPHWNDIERKKPEELGDKPVPVPICPP